MDVIGKIFAFAWNIVVFFLVTIFFVPALFIVTYFQEYWSKKLSELFNF